MAQTSNDLLNKILGVITKIDKKIDPSSKSSGKSDPGTGSLSGMFGSKKGTENAKAGAAVMSDMLKSLSGFGKLKVNTKNINNTSKALKSLFDVIVGIGRKQKTIQNAINLFNSMGLALRGMTAFAKAFSGLLLSFGASILLIAGSIWIASKILGTTGAAATMLAIGSVILGLVGIMYVVSKAGKNVDAGTKTAQSMGKALMYLSGGLLSFVVSLQLISSIMKTGNDAKGIALGVATMVAVVAGTAFMFWLLSKADTSVNKGSKVAGNMGKGMMLLSGGLLIFAGTLKLISMMMAGDGSMKSMAVGMIGVMGMVAGLAITFAIMGMASSQIKKGVGVAAWITLGLVALSLGVMAVVGVSKYLTELGKSEDGTNVGGKTTGFGAMMSKIGPGLGLFGGVIVTAGLLFAGLGIPVVAGLIGLGVLAALGIAGGMIALAYAVNKIVKVSKEIGDTNVQKTVTTLVSGVLIGFTEGIATGLSGDTSGIAGLAKSLKNMTVITGGIAMLLGVSLSLSMFAKTLTAFAKLDNMKVIEGYDKNGKPIFGEKINIKGVGANINLTLSSFLTGLIDSTSGLRDGQAGKIKKMAKALTGRRGILSAVIQFADVLKTFAEFGNDGKIGYSELTGYDSNDEPIYKFSSVKITDVAGNIASSFGTFVSELTSYTKDFELSGAKGKSMARLAEVLMGTEATKVFGLSFGKPSPGLLAPITMFADVLKTYSAFGSDGSMPELDENGNVIKGKSIKMTDVAKNIVKSISSFATALSNELGGDNSDIKNVDKRMDKYMKLITQMGRLSKAQEGLNKTASIINLLAASIGNLSTSLDKLDASKLGSISTTSTRIRIATKDESFGASLNNPSSTPNSYDTGTSSSVISSKSTTDKALLEEFKLLRASIDKLNTGENSDMPILIGQQVAAAFKSGQFHFDFHTDKSGSLTFD